jgi:hypothetical protein
MPVLRLFQLNAAALRVRCNLLSLVLKTDMKTNNLMHPMRQTYRSLLMFSSQLINSFVIINIGSFVSIGAVIHKERANCLFVKKIKAIEIRLVHTLSHTMRC